VKHYSFLTSSLLFLTIDHQSFNDTSTQFTDLLQRRTLPTRDATTPLSGHLQRDQAEDQAKLIKLTYLWVYLSSAILYLVTSHTYFTVYVHLILAFSCSPSVLQQLQDGQGKICPRFEKKLFLVLKSIQKGKGLF